ncbi:Aminomethyltransferase [compost metagenome]
MQAEKEAGVARKLIGFEMVDRGIPRHGYEIVNAEGEVVGNVTSGTQSPSLQKAIGMGYIDKALAKEGTEIFINIRNSQIKAKVVKFPFYK